MIYKKKELETHIRIPVEAKLKINELRLDISKVQKRDVPVSELMRRITNIPNLKNVLISDALAKYRNENKKFRI